MDIQVINKGSDISRLLGMKGLTRLAIEDELTSAILSAKFSHYSGLNLRFLETKKHSDWTEYSILLELRKSEETILDFITGLNQVSRFLEEVIEFDVDSIGIQETDCGSSDYYYILIYILK